MEAEGHEGDAAAAAGTAQQQPAVQLPAAAPAAVSRSSSRSLGRSPESIARESRRIELHVAGVPPKAARVFARMSITLGQPMRQDMEWAVACLAEEEVTLSYREGSSWR